MEYRKCSKCGKEYPLLPIYFHRSNLHKDGYHTQCKLCKNKRDRKTRKHYYREHRRKKIEEAKEKQNTFREKNELSYNGIHDRMRLSKKKPSRCPICMEENRLELCSIGHTYTDDPINWIWLCRACHQLFDECIEAMLNQ